jgi:hypothetical protein
LLLGGYERGEMDSIRRFSILLRARVFTQPKLLTAHAWLVTGEADALN